MNVQELYDAIGQADEAFVAHSQRTVTRGRQVFLRVCLSVCLITAALASVLTVTAAASPAFREWLFSLGTLNEAPIARPVAIESEGFGVFSEGMLEIRPEVELEKGFPTRIETFYVPMSLAETWRPGVVFTNDPAGYLAGLREQCCLYWDDPAADPPRSVRFCQYTGSYLELGTPMTWISLGYHREETGYSIEALELGGIPMQHVRVEASSVQLEHGSASSSGADYYFWTDGSYIFSLAVPLETEQEFVEAAAASLTPVEDVSPYLDLQPDAGTVVKDPDLTIRYQPGWIPEDWTQLDTSFSQAPWCAAYAWEKEGPGNTILTMLQLSQTDYALSVEATWASGLEKYTKTSLRLGEAEAILYESEDRIQLVLPLEDSVIDLESFGPQKLAPETLIRIAEQLEVVR